MSFIAAAVTGFNALNSIQQGRFASAQAGLQASATEYQAKVEEQNALETARVIRRAGQRQVGQANAAYAAAGVKVGEGSAGEVERDITQGYEHDAYQAILEGQRRGLSLRTDAAMTRINGQMAERAGIVNAMGTVLMGANSALKSNGWRTAGPGFSGQQAPAPVETRTIPRS